MAGGVGGGRGAEVPELHQPTPHPPPPPITSSFLLFFLKSQTRFAYVKGGFSSCVRACVRACVHLQLFITEIKAVMFYACKTLVR